MQIAVLEGYRMPRRSHRRKKMKTRKGSAQAKAMKACAKSHKVATKGFWTCVRAKRRK